MKTENPIEKIIANLPEIGDPLWLNVSKIDRLKGQIEEVEKELFALKTTLEVDRAKLTNRLLRNYTDSEIETADVICTQRAGQRAPIRDFTQGGFTGQAVKNQP